MKTTIVTFYAMVLGGGGVQVYSMPYTSTGNTRMGTVHSVQYTVYMPYIHICRLYGSAFVIYILSSSLSLFSSSACSISVLSLSHLYFSLAFSFFLLPSPLHSTAFLFSSSPYLFPKCFSKLAWEK
jgi:hypothetical protein